MVDPFESRPSPKLVFGNGVVKELPNSIKELGITSVLLVTDKGIVKAGHVEAWHEVPTPLDKWVVSRLTAYEL